jgi:hypothetical protein
LAVFPAFVCALAVNFVGVAGYQCWLDRASLAQKAREAVVPVLSAELFAILLTIGAVWIAVQTGTLGIALIGMMLLIFQYLVGELLKSKSRGEKLQRMATTDGLTGLANREAFCEWVEGRIASADTDTSFAVILIDLDRFKEINDTLGHHYGDGLLRANSVRAGGLRRRWVWSPARRRRVRGPARRVGLTILFTTSGAHGRDGCSHAFTSRSRSTSFRSRWLRASASPASRGRRRRARAAALRRHRDVRRQGGAERLQALRGRARPPLGPAAERARRHSATRSPPTRSSSTTSRSSTSRTSASAAPRRWSAGSIPSSACSRPGRFIQTVEQTGLIGPLTRHVLERVDRQCAAWRRAGRETCRWR